MKRQFHHQLYTTNYITIISFDLFENYQ